MIFFQKVLQVLKQLKFISGLKNNAALNLLQTVPDSFEIERMVFLKLVFIE